MKRKATQPEKNSIDALFRPRSVAVVGASRRRHSIGRETSNL